jgi:hypothetical protein
MVVVGLGCGTPVVPPLTIEVQSTANEGDTFAEDNFSPDTFGVSAFPGGGPPDDVIPPGPSDADCFKCGGCSQCTDNFNRPDNDDITEGSTCGWTKESGTSEIKDNYLNLHSNAIVTCDTETPGPGVYTLVAFRFRAVGDVIRAIVKWTDENDYYYSELTCGAESNLTLGHSKDGVDSVLAGGSSSILTEVNTTYELRTCYGNGGFGVDLVFVDTLETTYSLIVPPAETHPTLPDIKTAGIECVSGPVDISHWDIQAGADKANCKTCFTFCPICEGVQLPGDPILPVGFWISTCGMELIQGEILPAVHAYPIFTSNYEGDFVGYPAFQADTIGKLIKGYDITTPGMGATIRNVSWKTSASTSYQSAPEVGNYPGPIYQMIRIACNFLDADNYDCGEWIIDIGPAVFDVDDPTIYLGQEWARSSAKVISRRDGIDTVLRDGGTLYGMYKWLFYGICNVTTTGDGHIMVTTGTIVGGYGRTLGVQYAEIPDPPVGGDKFALITGTNNTHLVGFDNVVYSGTIFSDAEVAVYHAYSCNFDYPAGYWIGCNAKPKKYAHVKISGAESYPPGRDDMYTGVKPCQKCAEFNGDWTCELQGAIFTAYNYYSNVAGVLWRYKFSIAGTCAMNCLDVIVMEDYDNVPHPNNPAGLRSYYIVRLYSTSDYVDPQVPDAMGNIETGQINTVMPDADKIYWDGVRRYPFGGNDDTLGSIATSSMVDCGSGTFRLIDDGSYSSNGQAGCRLTYDWSQPIGPGNVPPDVGGYIELTFSDDP